MNTKEEMRLLLPPLFVLELSLHLLKLSDEPLQETLRQSLAINLKRNIKLPSKKRLC